jgi:hypothetical protein
MRNAYLCVCCSGDRRRDGGGPPGGAGRARRAGAPRPTRRPSRRAPTGSLAAQAEEEALKYNDSLDLAGLSIA